MRPLHHVAPQQHCLEEAATTGNDRTPARGTQSGAGRVPYRARDVRNVRQARAPVRRSDGFPAPGMQAQPVGHTPESMRCARTALRSTLKTSEIDWKHDYIAACGEYRVRDKRSPRGAAWYKERNGARGRKRELRTTLLRIWPGKRDLLLRALRLANTDALSHTNHRLDAREGSLEQVFVPLDLGARRVDGDASRATERSSMRVS